MGRIHGVYDEGVEKFKVFRRFPWAPILAVGFVLALLVNVLFAIDIYERNRVVSVPDGDSLQLKDGRRVRLLGIDAPERGRCMAGEARSKLVSLVQGRHVRLKDVVTDSYGRMLAIAIVEDFPTWLSYMKWKFLGSRPGLERGVYPNPDPLLPRALLSSGLARNRSSSGSQYSQVLRDAQEVARSGKLGIWSDACRGQTPLSADCVIKGNTRAGEKYYYVPSCSQYPQVLVDRAFGDSWFCTEVEAVRAGFTKSATCSK